MVYAPAFERDLEQALAAAVAVPRETRLVVTEGNYLLLDEPPWDAVRPLLDEVWFVEIDDAERVARLMARHVRYGKSQDQARAWMAAVDDPDAELTARGRDAADLVVTTTG